MDYQSASDKKLTDLLKGGDEKAYEEIYRRFWAVMYVYARRMLPIDDDARDLVQDLFVVLWSRASTIEFQYSLSSYLYGAIRNMILKKFQSSKVHQSYIDSFARFIQQDENVTDHLVRERLLAVEIEREIILLPEKMREAFELSRKSNLSYSQIAQQMNIAENTVRKQVSNALKILRVKLISLKSVII